MTATAYSATRSGRRVDLLSPERVLIRPVDIANGLAKINRWSGATREPFSVAQHSLLVADLVDRHAGPRAALYGLLHDGHEYLIGDIIESTSSALAVECPGYPRALRSLRWRVDYAIHNAFELDWPPPKEVADLLDHCHARIVATEVRDMLAPNFRPRDFALPDDTLDREIVALDWRDAERAFGDAVARYQVCAGINPLE